VATGVLLHAIPVVAQETEAALEEVFVEAPVVRRQVSARGPTGYTTEMIQLKRQFSYADLDLTKESDVKELEKRIEMTARAACEALDDMLDHDRQDATAVYRCTKQSIKQTQEELEALVAAAN